jgi:hypothetical protein
MLKVCGDWSGTVAPLKYVCATAILLIGLIGGLSQAQAYSQRVNSACEKDYYRLCSAYAIGSTSLSRCIEASRRALTKRCADALIAEGLVPRKYLKR